MNTILHPTDFSENSNSAFCWACTLARSNNATVIVLHVMLPLPAPLVDTPSPDRFRDAESQKELKGAFCWPQAPACDVVVTYRVAEGDVPVEIVRFAEAVKCDAIVMGTQGKTALHRLLVGSVTEQVLRNAKCPVLVVKDSTTKLPTTREVKHIS